MNTAQLTKQKESTIDLEKRAFLSEYVLAARRIMSVTFYSTESVVQEANVAWNEIVKLSRTA
jgi:hypothetical protein